MLYFLSQIHQEQDACKGSRRMKDCKMWTLNRTTTNSMDNKLDWSFFNMEQLNYLSLSFFCLFSSTFEFHLFLLLFALFHFLLLRFVLRIFPSKATEDTATNEEEAGQDPADVTLVVALRPEETLLCQDNLLPQVRDFKVRVIIFGPLHVNLDCTVLQLGHLVSHSVPELSDLWKWGKTHPDSEVFKEAWVILLVQLPHLFSPIFWFGKSAAADVVAAAVQNLSAWGTVGIRLQGVGKVLLQIWVFHILSIKGDCLSFDL